MFPGFNRNVAEIAAGIKNSPLFVKLFASLALFIIVPVLIVCLISNYAILHFAETGISKSGIGKLKVADSLTKLLADGVGKDALRLSLNADLNRLNNVTNYRAALKNINDVTLLSRFSNTLTEMVNTNDKYQSIALYIDDADYVFSAAKESSSVVLKQNYLDTGWYRHYRDFRAYKTNTLWLDTRMPKNSNIYIPKDIPGGKLPESPVNHVITYMYPLTPYTTKLQGALIINVYEDGLNKLINRNNFDSEGYIGIVTSKGDVISHVDKELVGRNIGGEKWIQKILRKKFSEGYLIDTIEHRKSLVTYLKTDLNDWIYIGVFPLDSLMAKATTLRFGTLYAALVLVLLGLFLSSLISRKLYHPVKTLIQDIQNHKKIDIRGNENEMTLIAKAFDTIIRQEDLLSDTLEKNKRNIRNNYLLSLLRDNEDQDNAVELFGETFPYPHFVCALIAIDKCEEFDCKYPKEQQYYMKEFIAKVAEEILPSATGLVLDRNKIVLIINAAKTGPQLLNELRESFGRIQQELTKVFDSVSIAIGDCHEGKRGLKTSFNEAQETLKRKLIQGGGRIDTWRAGYGAATQYYFPFSIEKHILNHLELGLKEETLAALNDLIAEIKNRTDLSYDNIVLIFNQLLGNTVKYLVESHLNISDIFGDDYNIYQQLATKETLDDIHCWLIHIYSRIFAYRETPAADNKTHFAKMMEYIRQNYKKDIDINMLAEYVGLSYSYVRKIFHDETGENIVNFINNFRINEAKRLLQETDMNINEIALSLGYNNNQSFNRFFKKYEGITPGEFRNIKSR
ncbi:AraC family transcriptional regulator [Hydrogenispora ethanolica]|uniref:AraC family transcriptional regulator n=1 Tax=Hydrogenispora ethanolica TaxID=1082276 RepID=A0A4R1QKN0_HYDET|nr:helix-turn-helix domain-containing protein [Hydrogenispora ethanolica]TCL54229.1 AraC family transcriptional regulator [Hydrogenispora ethanolica]